MKFFGKFVGAFLLMAATGLLSVTSMAVEAEAEAAFTPCTLDHVHCEADCTLDHQHCVHTGCNLDQIGSASGRDIGEHEGGPRA